MRRSLKTFVIAASILAAFGVHGVANDCGDHRIPEPPEPSQRERLDQMVSRGEARYLIMEVTAYTDDPESQGRWVGQTSTGMKPGRGIVAVDPDTIPIMTQVYVEGYGYAIAADVGGAITGDKMDIFVPTRGEAMEWGRQQRKVYILGGN